MPPHCSLLSKLSRLAFLDIPPLTNHPLLVNKSSDHVRSSCCGLSWGLKFQGMVLVVELIQHFHSWMAFLNWLLVGQGSLLASLALSAFASCLQLILISSVTPCSLQFCCDRFLSCIETVSSVDLPVMLSLGTAMVFLGLLFLKMFYEFSKVLHLLL